LAWDDDDVDECHRCIDGYKWGSPLAGKASSDSRLETTIDLKSLGKITLSA